MQASALLFHWGSYCWARNLWILIIYLFFLPFMLPSVVPRLITDLAVKVFPGVLKLLSFLRLPSRDGAPSLPLLSLFLSFIFFTSSFRRQWLFFFWVPDVLCRHSEGVSWFYSAFKCSFDELVGEKVVSPSYSSTILGLPLALFLISSASVKSIKFLCFIVPLFA